MNFAAFLFMQYGLGYAKLHKFRIIFIKEMNVNGYLFKKKGWHNNCIIQNNK